MQPFGGRLELLGWRALRCVEHYHELMGLMQAAWREVGVSLCALLQLAIARSDTQCVLRAYRCVNSVKLTVCIWWRFAPTDRKIERTVSSFELFFFELLDPEIFTNSTQHIFYVELMDPEMINYTNVIFGDNVDRKTVYISLGYELREATRMRLYRGLHRRIARTDAR